MSLKQFDKFCSGLSAFFYDFYISETKYPFKNVRSKETSGNQPNNLRCYRWCIRYFGCDSDCSHIFQKKTWKCQAKSVILIKKIP